MQSPFAESPNKLGWSFRLAAVVLVCLWVPAWVGCRSPESAPKKKVQDRSAGAGSPQKGKGQKADGRRPWGDPVAGVGVGAGASREPFSLEKLPQLLVTHESLASVQKRYVAPDRIKPEKMLLEGLREVQEEVAALRVRVVDGKTLQRKIAGRLLEIRIGNRVHLLPFSEITSVDDIYDYFRVILGLVRQELERTGKPTSDELASMEYAAINGFLGTLDPYSVLLPPDASNEMRIRTHGSFGGVGIVISIRNGALTVISPIDGTPAAKAGVQAGDRIVRIGDESTVNMPLHEAVSRLRGKIGTQVTFWVERDSLPEPKRYVITRAEIEIHSVSSKMLPGRIGYLRVSRFSDNTYDELKKNVRKLVGGGAGAIVLDLTNNPGGLLKQAVAVADAFVDEGIIVVTEAAKGEKVETASATRKRTLWRGPLAVLVNRGSASASEIVAGALKYLGRAVVLGERSFGKGTVQVLLNLPADESMKGKHKVGPALKLTVARYLVRGDVPIQTVGIVPDILTVPLTVRKDWVRFAARRRRSAEEELDDHLSAGRETKVPEPHFTLHYLKTEQTARKVSVVADAGADPSLLALARDLMLRYHGNRKEILASCSGFLKRERRRQQRRVMAALRRLGVDWRQGSLSTAGPSRFQVRLTTDQSDSSVKAGQKFKLTLSVRNLGAQDAFRMRAVLKAPGYYLDGREFVLGRIAPGKERLWSIDVRVPTSVRDQIHPIQVRLYSDNAEVKSFEPLGASPGPFWKVRFVQIPRPVLSLKYRFEEKVGDGDGRLEPGETAAVVFRVANEGPEPSKDLTVSLRNLSGLGLFIEKGRHTIKQLLPGSGEDVTLVFRLLKDFGKKHINLELGTYDSRVRLGFEDRLKIDLSRPLKSVHGQMVPPTIQTKPVPLSTDRDRIEIEGFVRHANTVRDVYMFTANVESKQPREKVFYAPGGSGKTGRVEFRATAGLLPGLNTILIVARTSKHLLSYQLLKVLKEPLSAGPGKHAPVSQTTESP